MKFNNMKYPFFKAIVFLIIITSSFVLFLYTIYFIETLQVINLIITSLILALMIKGLHYLFTIKDVSKILFLDKFGIDITKE